MELTCAPVTITWFIGNDDTENTFASMTLVIIGLGNGLLTIWRSAISWTNCGSLVANFNDIWIQINIFWYVSKMSSAQCQPFCSGIDVFKDCLWSRRQIPRTSKWCLRCNSAHQRKANSECGYQGAKTMLSTWAPSQYKDRLIYVWRFPC